MSLPQTPLADGAAYSPSTREWTTLPVSPLSARDDVAAVWTGTDLFLWGGTTTNSLNGDTNGALYDPSTHVWSMLPPSPLPSGDHASATWTGTTIVVVVDVPAATPPDTMSRVAAATYSPTTHMWHVLPSLASSPGHTIVQTEAVEDAGHFTLFDGWEDMVWTPSSVAIRSDGDDVETLDATTGQWTLQLSSSNLSASVASRPPGLLSTPIATPYGVYFSPIYQCGFAMSCPYLVGIPVAPAGFLYSPSHHQWSSVPPTPSSSGNPVAVWTGAAVVEVSTATSVSLRRSSTCHPTGQCPEVTIPAGTTAAYNPKTHTWTNLAKEPDTVAASIAVWCGDRVIIFGDLDPGAASALAHATGIQLGLDHSVT